MIQAVGDRIVVEGAMNLSTATSLLDAGNKAIQGGQVAVHKFDLSAVTEVDSAGLAVVFGWMRAAKGRNQAVNLVNSPQGLLSMADVYGVSDLLPLA
jgi:phospholipid transport system transporter-binding protein